jgi:hypothetical protein
VNLSTPQPEGWGPILVAYISASQFHLRNQCKIYVIKELWTFSETTKGGVDIHIPQVKISLNFRRDRAEFGGILQLHGSSDSGFLKGAIWKRV